MSEPLLSPDFNRICNFFSILICKEFVSFICSDLYRKILFCVPWFCTGFLFIFYPDLYIIGYQLVSTICIELFTFCTLICKELFLSWLVKKCLFLLYESFLLEEKTWAIFILVTGKNVGSNRQRWKNNRP